MVVNMQSVRVVMQRGSQKVVRNWHRMKKEKMRGHHEFHNLVDQYDLWWCKKKETNGLNWME